MQRKSEVDFMGHFNPSLCMCFSSTCPYESNNLNINTVLSSLLTWFFTILGFFQSLLQRNWVVVFPWGSKFICKHKSSGKFAPYYTVSKYSRLAETPDEKGQGSSSDSLPNSQLPKQILPRAQTKGRYVIMSRVALCECTWIFLNNSLIFKCLC